MNVEYEEHDPSEMTRPTIDEEMSGEKMIAGGMQDKILTLALPAKDVNELLASVETREFGHFQQSNPRSGRGAAGRAEIPGCSAGRRNCA